MEKISSLGKVIPFLIISMIPVPGYCEIESLSPIVAVGKVRSVEFLMQPDEEVGGPLEGVPYFGSVFEVKVRFVRFIGEEISRKSLKMRAIAGHRSSLTESRYIIMIMKYSDKFGYRIDRWMPASSKSNACIPESVVASYQLQANFPNPDGQGNRCEKPL